MIIEQKFNVWWKLKKKLHFLEWHKNYPKIWEVWYIHIWVNIWNEALWKWDDFKRPVLIIKKLWNMFFCVAMTTKWKENNLFYKRISNSYFDKSSYIVKSQLKSIDEKRFIEKIGRLSNKDLFEIKKELQNFIF